MTRGIPIHGAALAAVCVLVACNDGLLHPPAAAEPASLAIAANVQGDAAAAFNHADQLLVRFSAEDELRLEEELAFDPSDAETRVAVHVPLRDLTETLMLDLELRMNGDALFRGGVEVTLSMGRTASVDVDLVPVIAAVRCAGEPVQLASYGETASLTAEALFASGDVVEVADDPRPIQWSTSDGAVVGVQPDGPRGARVTALQDGTAEVECALDGRTDTRPIQVFAVVRSVQVAPGQSTVLVGGTAAFSATLRDARQNVITGRTVTWTAGTPSVATVSGAGVATGVAPGTSTIRATSAGVTGTATLIVEAPPPPPPTVTTTGAEASALTARLDGTVNPNGVATQAWFEWGTSPTLDTFTETTPRSMGSGGSPVSLAETISDLQPGTTYYARAAATSAGGTTRGSIVSFATPAPGAPSVRAVSSSWIEPSDAVLEMFGAVTPNGSPTHAWFEWSDDPEFRQFGASQAEPVGDGFEEIMIETEDIMPCGTVYFRVAAINGFTATRDAVRSAPRSAGEYWSCIG